MHKIKRRNFLTAGLGLASMTLLSSQITHAKNKQYQELLPLISQLLPHIKSSANLGWLLLSSNKISIKDSEKFMAQIFLPLRDDSIKIEQHLANMVRADFKSSKLIEVEDWQLSRTECLLATSAHIIKQKNPDYLHYPA